MNIALITIGNELLSGFTVNTNASWIGNHVIKVGGHIKWHQTIGDSKEEIQSTLKNVPIDVKAVIITGGLGPTHDDVTAHALYEYVEDTPEFDEEYWEFLKERLSIRNLKLPEINRNQAMRPKNGKIIPNSVGSARGLHFNYEEKNIFALPGVPREMRAMMDAYVLPWIKENSGGGATISTIRTTGVMESGLAEKLSGLIDCLDPNVSVAFLPQFIGVDIRISSLDKSKLEHTIDEMKDLIGKYIYGFENEDLEKIIGKLLNDQSMTLATAESCTGGLVSHRLTNVPGSSEYYVGGIVSYSNDVKAETLGVSKTILEEQGAVSKETACEMAENIRSKLSADLGLSITGIAGPTGGTDEKPIGLTFIALASANGTQVKEFRFLTDRKLNKNASSQAALNMVRLHLINE